MEHIGGLAHLVMAHRDPQHVVRLCRKLAAVGDVYVHIEARAEEAPFREPLADVANVRFIAPRFHCRWGSLAAIQAEIALLSAALCGGEYGRFVFLQGADYPLRSPGELMRFFESHPDTEFVRGCDVTASADPYFKEMCRVVFFRSREDIFHKALEKLMQRGRLYLRDGLVPLSGQKVHAFWGAAQWAVTRPLAEYLVALYKEQPAYSAWFRHAFPVDEMWVTTAVMNSPFRARTVAGGPEPEQRGLVNWRNLHYFEYPGAIRIYREEDYDFLLARPELYFRKATTELSTGLLDRLDARHEAADAREGL